MTQPPQQPQGGPNPEWQGQPPQGGYQYQGGYPQQGGPQPPQKKKGGCMKTGLIVLAVLIVLGIIITAISSGDDDSPAVTSGDDSSETANGSADDAAGGGVDFMGKTDKDTGANAGDTITMDDIAITATPLEPFPSDGYLDPQLCTTVTVQNNGDSQERFNTFDWTLQDPNGTAKSASWMNPSSAPDLSSGEIAPGGQTSGAICFDGNPSAQPGEYVVIYTGNIFRSDRLAWVNHL